MYKLFKLGFKLGYKFAERHYYQKLLMLIRSKSTNDFDMYEADTERKKERVQKRIEIERELESIIMSAFSVDEVRYSYPERILPFEQDINDIL